MNMGSSSNWDPTYSESLISDAMQSESIFVCDSGEYSRKHKPKRPTISTECLIPPDIYKELNSSNALSPLFHGILKESKSSSSYLRRTAPEFQPNFGSQGFQDPMLESQYSQPPLHPSHPSQVAQSTQTSQYSQSSRLGSQNSVPFQPSAQSSPPLSQSANLQTSFVPPQTASPPQSTNPFLPISGGTGPLNDVQGGIPQYNPLSQPFHPAGGLFSGLNEPSFPSSTLPPCKDNAQPRIEIQLDERFPSPPSSLQENESTASSTMSRMPLQSLRTEKNNLSAPSDMELSQTFCEASKENAPRASKHQEPVNTREYSYFTSEIFDRNRSFHHTHPQSDIHSTPSMPVYSENVAYPQVYNPLGVLYSQSFPHEEQPLMQMAHGSRTQTSQMQRPFPPSGSYHPISQENIGSVPSSRSRFDSNKENMYSQGNIRRFPSGMIRPSEPNEMNVRSEDGKLGSKNLDSKAFAEFNPIYRSQQVDVFEVLGENAKVEGKPMQDMYGGTASKKIILGERNVHNIQSMHNAQVPHHSQNAFDYMKKLNQESVCNTVSGSSPIPSHAVHPSNLQTPLQTLPQNDAPSGVPLSAVPTGVEVPSSTTLGLPNAHKKDEVKYCPYCKKMATFSNTQARKADGRCRNCIYNSMKSGNAKRSPSKGKH